MPTWQLRVDGALPIRLLHSRPTINSTMRAITTKLLVANKALLVAKRQA